MCLEMISLGLYFIIKIKKKLIQMGFITEIEKGVYLFPSTKLEFTFIFKYFKIKINKLLNNLFFSKLPLSFTKY